MEKEINLKAIIFDKDGTLFDYSSVWHEVISKSIDKAFNKTNIKRKEKRKKDLIQLLGIDEDGKTIASGVIFSHGKFNITKKGLKYCLTNFIRPSSLIKFTKKIQEYNNILIEEKIKSMDFSKQKKLFKSLKDQGYKIGIVTIDNKISAELFVKYMDIEKYVDYLSTNDDDLKNKPNPDSLNYFCNKFNIFPEEVAIVGDTISDMKYAINGKAGYKIALLWGSNDYTNLKKYADVIYPNLYYLLEDNVIFNNK